MTINITRRFAGERGKEHLYEVLVAERDGVPVGTMHLKHDPDYSFVKWVKVEPDQRKNGIATQLYVKAAEVACTEYGRPIASDTERSGYTQRFWEKQVERGRARCVESTAPYIPARRPRGGDAVIAIARGACVRYQMIRCETSDLRGAPRLRRRKKR